MAYSQDLTVGGIATASSTHPTTYHVSKAFDNDTTTYWLAQATTSPQWIKYQFPTAKAISKIRLRPDITTGVLLVRNFKLYASNDDATWTLLFSGATSVNADQWFEYLFTNTTKYLYYKFDIIDHWYTPFNGYFTSIRELEMMEKLPLLKKIDAGYPVFNSTAKSSSSFYGIGHKLPISRKAGLNYNVIQPVIKATALSYSVRQSTVKHYSTLYMVLGSSVKTFNSFYHLFPPVVEIYSPSGQKIDALDIGLLKLSKTSIEAELVIWNNKAGGAIHLDMSEIFIGVSLSNGNFFGGTLQDGQEVVDKKFVELKSSGVSGAGIIDDAQTVFTPVGGKPPTNALAVGSILSGTGRHIFLRFNLPATINTELSAWSNLFISYTPATSNGAGFGVNFGFNFGA